MSRAEGAPTMIIPSGTEIQIDVHGQLSIRTPGNLVIQNSGHYGEIESVHGSIRIEANAEVEAVAVKCAETCYVQGSLTSWKVKARSINLEEKAQARVVLQETEQVEIGKNAKLVGNFGSEKELFLLFSRFTEQLKSLPFYFDRSKSVPPAQLQAPEAAASIPESVEVSPVSSRAVEASSDLPDQLFFALVLLEREARNDAYASNAVRVVEELVKLLRNRDLETLRHTHRTLFERVVEPGEDLIRARELIEGHFSTNPGNLEPPLPPPPDVGGFAG
ncbi:MAG: hypothetical protein MI919_35460 [Holophagales bacterium]|nr:hypothetical protein [Holophagales bacterium]